MKVRWTLFEDNRLLRLIEGGVPSKEILRQTGRSIGSVQMRMWKLGYRWAKPAPPQTPERHRANALIWQYGPERAREIINGRDPEAKDDLASWRRFGRAG